MSEAPDDFERVCAQSDVAPGTLHAATLTDGSRVCVANDRGRFVAMNDRCPHQKYPLSDGSLTVRGTIVCSWHGAEYDCTTGRGVQGPLSGDRREGPLGRLLILETQLRGGDVFVRPPQPAF